jgi:hypothetical protein
MSTDTQAKKHNTDLIGGILMLAVAAFFQFHMDPDFSPMASYFPERLIVCMAVLGGALLIKAHVRPVYMDSFIYKLNAPVVFTILVGLAWVLLLEWIGFTISSIAAIFIILYRFEPRARRTPKRIAKMAAIAAGEVAVIYIVFVKLLHVTMPVGRLFG